MVHCGACYASAIGSPSYVVMPTLVYGVLRRQLAEYP